MKNTIVIICSLIFFSINAFAQTPPEKKEITSKAREEATDFLRNLDYPELMVVPRASERLVLEAQNEREMGALMHWTFEISGLATLTAGFMSRGKYKQESPTDQEKKDHDNASLTAIGVGATWLGIATYYTLRKPYQTTAASLRSARSGDRKSDLLRERLAEEGLQRPAEEIKMLTHLSVISNLAASMYVLSMSNGDMRYYAVMAGFASITPYLFDSRYVENFNKHQEYKRKIYAPLVGYTVDANLKPMLTASWSF